MTFARWGLPTLLCVTLFWAWALWLLPEGLPRWLFAPVVIFCVGFTIAFFRNPHRTPQGGENCLIAPADGLVWDVTEVDEPDFIGSRAVRIGIFLSVFDVHVNRSPCTGTIRYAAYKPGKFLDVRHPDCAHENEANTLGIEVSPAVAPGGLKILVRQLSGLIARRIICTHGVGDQLGRGELYGMIKFGSRTELWLPVTAPHTVKVKKGDRVKCGETILVELGASGSPT
jgi:phosphatidylserine decarboxylase